MLGQPSRGLTILSRDSAKLPMARAAMPIFSPSCGSTRITIGPAKSKPDLVLSVPDISRLHLLIQFLKLIQPVKALNHRDGLKIASSVSDGGPIREPAARLTNLSARSLKASRRHGSRAAACAH